MSFASKRDDNNVPAIFGVSSIDLKTPTAIKVNPLTGAILIDGSSLGVNTPTTYIIYQSGGTYYAQNGTTQVVDYSGADVGLIINNLITNKLSSGGKISLREGTFTVSTSIALNKSNILIEGMGNATILQAANALNGNVISITGSSIIYTKVKNLIIDGNKANQSSGNGFYLYTPVASFSGHAIEDVLVQNCKNDGFNFGTSGGTSSIYLLRCRATGNNGNGFNLPFDVTHGASLTDSVFDTCIADTNALHGFYLGCVDSHFINCKSYYNGSATGNYHGYYIAGYNNYFTHCEAQDNYQSGFYTQNDGDATFGAQNCTFVNCDADSNNQTVNASYGVGFQIKNTTGWILIGCQAYTRPYPSFTQRIGVSLEGTTAKTQITNLQGLNNSSSLYSNTASGGGNVLYGLNAAGTRITFDGGTNDFEWDNVPELFWNQANPDISLYSGSDNRLDILNAGGGKGNLNTQNILTFGYGDYLGVSPTNSWPSGTHKLLEVGFDSTDFVKLYTPGSTTANKILEFSADQKMGFFNTTRVSQQVSGANLTNSVTSGGTSDVIADFTSLTVYATDAATIRNDIYQLARKLKQVNDALRAYGLLT